MHYFCPKYMRFELKKYRGVIFHDTEQWCKIWIKPGLRVSKMGWGIWHGWTFTTAPKSLKSYTLIGSLCTKHIMFQIENFRGIICYKGVAIFKGKRTCGLKNEIRNLVNFHASRQKCENLHFDGILLSKACKDLDEKVRKSYVSWHWRVMQSFKKNWLLVPKMT